MFLSRRRIILMVAIGAIAITIVLLPLILTVTLPNLNSVTIGLTKVDVVNRTSANIINLNVFFSIHNPTDTTLTTSGIDYELFANGTLLGPGSLSYADVPVNGRPQLFSKTTLTLPSQFQVIKSQSNSQVFKLLQNPAAIKHIKWKADGVTELESGVSSASKPFSAIR